MASMLQNFTRLGVIQGCNPCNPVNIPAGIIREASPPELIDEIFVSTKLAVLTPYGIPKEQQDYWQDGITYRRLDPRYFLWLRGRMLKARVAFKASKIPVKTWELMRGLFNPIQEWAIAHIGSETIKAEEALFDPDDYSLPIDGNASSVPDTEASQWLYPMHGCWSFRQKVTDANVAKVFAIREEAKSMGWSEAALFQNQSRFSFPYGSEYGLVCFLGFGEITSVTRDHISIVKREANNRQAILRFHNPVFLQG